MGKLRYLSFRYLIFQTSEFCNLISWWLPALCDVLLGGGGGFMAFPAEI